MLEHPLLGAALVTAFLDQTGHVVLDRVADHFGTSKAQLADTIGLASETLYRPARLRAPKTQARATEMLEILGRVAAWAGGPRQAMACTAPNRCPPSAAVPPNSSSKTATPPPCAVTWTTSPPADLREMAGCRLPCARSAIGLGAAIR